MEMIYSWWAMLPAEAVFGIKIGFLGFIIICALWIQDKRERRMIIKERLNIN